MINMHFLLFILPPKAILPILFNNLYAVKFVRLKVFICLVNPIPLLIPLLIPLVILLIIRYNYA